jgi:hypothetical protein
MQSLNYLQIIPQLKLVANVLKNHIGKTFCAFKKHPLFTVSRVLVLLTTYKSQAKTFLNIAKIFQVSQKEFRYLIETKLF